jgi:uncharacterized repeat protein (TIGR04076 family)
MPFQIKATVVGFLGDEEKYPCHFLHKIGDEFIYDGEKFVGRICPSVLRVLIPAMMPLHAAGPRFMPPAAHYYPFFYSTMSRKDPSRAKYDGLGFQNVLDMPNEPQYHMANMAPPGAFNWPPIKERTINLDAFTIVCPDIRTAMVIKARAFDLSDKGYDIPYYRREMVILDRVSKQQSIPATEVINLFSKEEIEQIHPALSPILIECLNEELVLMGYLEIKDGKAFVTDKGREKVAAFKAGSSTEVREALRV